MRKKKSRLACSEDGRFACGSISTGASPTSTFTEIGVVYGGTGQTQLSAGAVQDRTARRLAGLALTLVLALIGVMLAAALTGCSAPRATADAGRSLVQSAADLERDLGVLERATVAAKDVTPEKLEAARRQTRAHVAAIGTLGAQLVRLGETGKP